MWICRRAPRSTAPRSQREPRRNRRRHPDRTARRFRGHRVMLLERADLHRPSVGRGAAGVAAAEDADEQHRRPRGGRIRRIHAASDHGRPHRCRHPHRRGPRFGPGVPSTTTPATKVCTRPARARWPSSTASRSRRARAIASMSSTARLSALRVTIPLGDDQAATVRSRGTAPEACWWAAPTELLRVRIDTGVVEWRRPLGSVRGLLAPDRHAARDHRLLLLRRCHRVRARDRAADGKGNRTAARQPRRHRPPRRRDAADLFDVQQLLDALAHRRERRRVSRRRRRKRRGGWPRPRRWRPSPRSPWQAARPSCGTSTSDAPTGTEADASCSSARASWNGGTKASDIDSRTPLPGRSSPIASRGCLRSST